MVSLLAVFGKHGRCNVSWFKNVEQKSRKPAPTANFKRCALTIVENSDTTDKAQLAIFTRDIDNKYHVTEEIATLVLMRGTAKSLDLCEAVKMT